MKKLTGSISCCCFDKDVPEIEISHVLQGTGIKNPANHWESTKYKSCAGIESAAIRICCL